MSRGFALIDEPQQKSQKWLNWNFVRTSIKTVDTMNQEKSQRYWHKMRQLATIMWLLLLFLSFVLSFPAPFFLIFTAGSAIFLDRPSFRVGIVITLALSAAFLLQPLFLRELIEGLDNRMHDTFFQLRGPHKPSRQVVIADIDQKSLDEMGQWPWPRSEMAKIVDILHEDGALVIGFDILFAEQDRMSLENWLSRIQTLGFEIENTHIQLGGHSEHTLSKNQEKQIILSDWKKRLQKRYPEIELKEESQIISAYIQFRQDLWNQEESTRLHRLKMLDLPYKKRVYHAPENVLMEMARSSRELFCIQNHADRSRLIFDNDNAFGLAIKRARAVTGGLFIMPTSGSAHQHYHHRHSVWETEGMIIQKGIQGPIDQVFPFIRLADRQILNVDQIQKHTLHQGMLNVVPDKSGAARYYSLLMRAPVFQETLILKEGKENIGGAELLNPNNYKKQISAQSFVYPSLALEMLRVGKGYDMVEVGFRENRPGLYLRREEGFHYPDRRTQPLFSQTLTQFIPLDTKGDLPVDYLGYGGRWSPESLWEEDNYFPYYSLSDIAQKKFTPGTFKDKYIIIGSTDPTLSDLVSSPFRSAFPGLEVHATMLENLLSERYLLDFGGWETLCIFLGMLSVGTLFAFISAYSGVSGTMLASIATFLLLPAIAYYGIAYGGFLFHFTFPWLSGGILSATITITNIFFEQRDRRFVTKHFSSMISPDLLQKLRSDPEIAELGGQRAQVSVFMSDIENFTRLAETLNPKEMVSLLNDYLTPCSDIILKTDGFIDKFIGDAVMAVWGVPYPDAQHAEKACLAALKQQKLLEKINSDLERRYGFSLRVRMGIATGEVSAALTGSEQRKSYTIIGDRVNVASRLESANKIYGSKILICKETREIIKEKFITRCIDRVLLKGKTTPVLTYELIGTISEVSEEQKNACRLVEKALELSWKREWDKALKCLAEAEKFWSDDRVADFLHSRLVSYQKEPPPKDWDGSTMQLTK